MPYYIDSSALVKLFVDEAGSDALRNWFSEFDGNSISSELTRTEMLRAVRRKTPNLISNAQDVLRRTPLLTLTPDMFEQAGLLDPLSLRSLDALHLACALSLGMELEGLVTYDNRLAEAATFLGIQTVAPA